MDRGSYRRGRIWKRQDCLMTIEREDDTIVGTPDELTLTIEPG